MELFTRTEINHKKEREIDKGRNVDKFQNLFNWVFSFFLLVFFTGVNAQETVVDIFDLPEPERCVSNDLRVVSATLEYDLCGPICEPGEIIEYPLTLAIFNNTGSERTTFAFFGRLEQYNPDGTLANTYFVSGCKGPVPPNTTTSITFDESLEILDQNGDPTSYQGIPYLCGGSLKLINLYEAWTDASDNDNRQCPLDASKIAPKCGVLPSIEIQTPINAFVEDVTDVSCYGYSDGAIDITVSGGYEPYTFLWSKDGGGFSASTEDVTGLYAGTYYVTITDAQGCEFMLEDIIVNEPSELQATVNTVVDVSCYGYSDGSITIDVIGGTPPYAYSWTGPDGYSADTEDISGLAAGSYSVTVTDDNDCKDTISEILVGEPDELVATLDMAVDATCYGYSDGSITIDVTGGTPPYTYSWTGPDGYSADTEDISGLAAGSYSVTVTDDNDCTDTISEILVGEPDELVATLDMAVDATCYGYSDGSITIDVTGGTSPYTYSWTGPDGYSADTEDISGLAAGSYSVTVTDDNDCTDTISEILVGEPDELVATLDMAVDATCYGYSDGSITIDVIGGTSPYTYSWTGPDGYSADTEDISGLAAGSYSVTVTDDNDCTDTISEILVGEPDELVATLDMAVDATCYGYSDGSITIDVTGGTSPYTYSWTGPDGYSADTEDISGLAAGSYSVTVTDDNDCTDTISGILVGEPDELVASVTSVTDASCAGFETGAIDISVVGGTPPYTYEWSNGATSQDLTEIGAGSYSVTVTDSNGCEDTIADIMVEDPSSLEVTATTVTDVSCFGFENGAINITVTGGTSPYTYLWSNGATTEDVSGLDAGTYWVTVTDANLCEYTLSDILVGEPTQIPPPEVQIAPADCFQTSGSFSIVNAPEDFEYSLDGGQWFSYTGTITNVTPGPHSLVARDANECESEPLNFDIPEPFETPSAPTVTAVQPDCETLTGSIIVTSGTVGFMFSINDGPFVNYPMGGFTGLAPGNYTVRVKSNDGCISDYTYITLEEPICDDFTGCTLGYWKNHTDRWCDAYETCDIYGEIFSGAPSQLAGLTLLEVLNLGGGGIYNLGRQSVAALLNACSDEVNYELQTPGDVIAYVEANFGNAGAAGSYLDMLNQRDCPLGGSKATTAPSDGCNVGNRVETNLDGFSVSPVPFRESINVKYDFDYVSNAVIQMYDMQGRLLSTHKEANASKGKITNLSINFRTLPSQVYVIKVTTDRDVFTKKIVSDK